MKMGSKISKPSEVVDTKKLSGKEIPYDRQKNSAFNDRMKQIKGGLLNKKGNKPEGPPTSVSSETIWREVNLFWPETIALVATIVAVAITLYVMRFMSASGLELIKDQLTETAYGEVAGLIMNLNSIFLAVAAVPLLVMIGFYLFRMVTFTPKGDKYLVARIKRTGAIRLSVEKIKDMKLRFDKSLLSDEMTVSNPRKHWVETTGKPFILLFEGDDSNADLNLMAGDVSQKAKDTNTINDMMFDMGVRWERKMREKAEGLMTPTNILLILILGAIGLTLFLVLKNPETTAQLMGPVAMIGGF